MKGAVFIALNDMVEEHFGIEVWDAALAIAQPESQGIYTSGTSYSDAEVVALISAISKVTSEPVEPVVRSFGQYLFKELNAKFPIFTKAQNNFFDFLNSIDGVIHKEVNKLYEDASLPVINCEKVDDSNINMYYSSPRNLCVLAEGLVFGAADFYQLDVDVGQRKCSLRGDEACEINIKIR